jgi:P27 family predicted phage terminase small subunit
MPRRGPLSSEFHPAPQLVRPIDPADLPKPPSHLAPETQAWWIRVVSDYELGEHHLRLLEAVCDAWDRTCEARAVLAREGLTISTKDGGKRRHPAADIERDSRTAFFRGLRELDLDAEAPPERPGWRPPPLHSNRRR